jgi:Tfp pilus assembly PilM family ATPase
MRLPAFLATPAPTVAVQIAPRFVSAVSVARRGATAVVESHAVESLPAGAVTASLAGPAITDRRGVGRIVGRVLGALGTRTRRVALVVPDSVAKVSLVKLDAVPARQQDLDQLIRWHVRKSAPFPIEDAQVTYSAGAQGTDGGREFVVAIARRAVIEQFEGACSEAGVHAGLVDLATFSLVNAVLAYTGSVAGDWLMVHVTPDYGSIAILRGSDLIFFRSRAEGSDESLPDLVHQTAMYYEDRLGGTGFTRVVMADGGGDGLASPGTATFDAIRRQIDARLGVRTEGIDPARVVRFSERIAADPALINVVAPLVGALAGAAAAD